MLGHVQRCHYKTRLSANTRKHRCSDQDLHLDDGPGVSDLSSVSYRQRVIPELQVKLLEVDLDHLEGQGMSTAQQSVPRKSPPTVS